MRCITACTPSTDACKHPSDISFRLFNQHRNVSSQQVTGRPWFSRSTKRLVPLPHSRQVDFVVVFRRVPCLGLILPFFSRLTDGMRPFLGLRSIPQLGSGKYIETSNGKRLGRFSQCETHHPQNGLDRNLGTEFARIRIRQQNPKSHDFGYATSSNGVWQAYDQGP